MPATGKRVSAGSRPADLGGQEEVEPLLGQALALIVHVTGASTAYLELYDNHRGDPRNWKGHRCSDEWSTVGRRAEEGRRDARSVENPHEEEVKGIRKRQPRTAEQGAVLGGCRRNTGDADLPLEVFSRDREL
jgi:hypothetical protein